MLKYLEYVHSSPWLGTVSVEHRYVVEPWPFHIGSLPEESWRFKVKRVRGEGGEA